MSVANIEEGERCSSPNEAATRTLRKTVRSKQPISNKFEKGERENARTKKESRVSGTGQNHLGLVGRERLLHLHCKGREIILASCRATCRDSQRSNILIPRTSLS